MGTLWAVSGHMHACGFNDPGAENVEPVIVNTGGPPFKTENVTRFFFNPADPQGIT